METLGFMSISGLNAGKKDVIVPEASPKFERMYIDNNLFSLQHHSGTNESTFGTELGRNVTKAISAARKDLQLDHAFGCAPHDYWLNRAPYPSNDSLLTLLEERVLPGTFNDSKTPSMVITNSGALRFDVFKGPFTIDSTFLISPFTSGFRVLKNIPYKAATQILSILNNEGPIMLSDLVALTGGDEHDLTDLSSPFIPMGMQSRAYAEQQTPFGIESLSNGNQQTVLGGGGSKKSQVPGYTTKDDAGSDGDDTIHQPIKFYNVPNVIGANITSGVSVESPEKVDIVYNEFLEGWVILALRYLGEKREKTDSTSALNGKTLTDILSDWVHANWACEKK